MFSRSSFFLAIAALCYLASAYDPSNGFVKREILVTTPAPLTTVAGGGSGSAGPVGPPGPPGPKGATGVTGLNGRAGRNGTNGEKGDTGPAGDPSPPGPPGEQGYRGDNAPNGFEMHQWEVVLSATIYPGGEPVDCFMNEMGCIASPTGRSTFEYDTVFYNQLIHGPPVVFESYLTDVHVTVDNIPDNPENPDLQNCLAFLVAPVLPSSFESWFLDGGYNKDWDDDDSVRFYSVDDDDNDQTEPYHYYGYLSEYMQLFQPGDMIGVRVHSFNIEDDDEEEYEYNYYEYAGQQETVSYKYPGPIHATVTLRFASFNLFTDAPAYFDNDYKRQHNSQQQVRDYVDFMDKMESKHESGKASASSKADSRKSRSNKDREVFRNGAVPLHKQNGAQEMTDIFRRFANANITAMREARGRRLASIHARNRIRPMEADLFASTADAAKKTVDSVSKA